MDTSSEIKKVRFQQTVLGRIGIAESGGVLTDLLFDGESLPSAGDSAGTPLLDEAFRQFDAWFAGKLVQFSLPLAPEGTEFEQRVWRALLEIPYARTVSYGEIALSIGAPGAARAVGGACGRNPLPILIPCHRVVRSDGTPGGYRGGLDIKRYILDFERRNLVAFDVKIAKSDEML